MERNGAFEVFFNSQNLALEVSIVGGRDEEEEENMMIVDGKIVKKKREKIPQLKATSCKILFSPRLDGVSVTKAHPLPSDKVALGPKLRA